MRSQTVTGVAPDVESLLPHAGPMVLIDRVIEGGLTSTRAAVRIGEDSMFYETPHGVPAYVGIEYIAQTVAAHAGIRALREDEPVRIGFLLGTRRYECTESWFRLGSNLTIEVAPVIETTFVSKFRGLITDEVRGEIASCAVSVYLQSQEHREF